MRKKGRRDKNGSGVWCISKYGCHQSSGGKGREGCGSGFTAIFTKPGNPARPKDEEEDVEMMKRNRARKVRHNDFISVMLSCCRFSSFALLRDVRDHFITWNTYAQINQPVLRYGHFKQSGLFTIPLVLFLIFWLALPSPIFAKPLAKMSTWHSLLVSPLLLLFLSTSSSPHPPGLLLSRRRQSLRAHSAERR